MDDYGVFFPSDVKVLFCGLVVEPQHQLQPAAAFGLSACRRSLKVFFSFVCRRSQRHQQLNSGCLFLSFSAVCPVTGCELLFSMVVFVKRWQTFLLRLVSWSTRLVSGKWCCCGIMAASFPNWRRQTSHTNIFGSTFFCLWWKKVVSSEFCFHSLNCPIDIQRMKSCWDTDRKWVGRTLSGILFSIRLIQILTFGCFIQRRLQISWKRRLIQVDPHSMPQSLLQTFKMLKFQQTGVFLERFTPSSGM